MSRTATIGLITALALATQSGCALIFPPGLKPPPPASQEPRPFAGAEWRKSATNGLGEKERRRYYLMDEGIQYLPVDMMMVMKRPVTDSLGIGSIVLSTSAGVEDLEVYDERLFEKPERIGLYPNPWNPKGPPLGITESTGTAATSSTSSRRRASCPRRRSTGTGPRASPTAPTPPRRS